MKKRKKDDVYVSYGHGTVEEKRSSDAEVLDTKDLDMEDLDIEDEDEEDEGSEVPQIFGVSVKDAEAAAAYESYLKRRQQAKEAPENTVQEQSAAADTAADIAPDIASDISIGTASDISLNTASDTVSDAETDTSTETELPEEDEFEEIDLEIMDQEDSEKPIISKRVLIIGLICVAVAVVLLIGVLLKKKDDNSHDPTGSVSGTGASVTEPSVTDTDTVTDTKTTEVEDTESYSIAYELNQDVEDSLFQVMQEYYRATRDCDLSAVGILYYDPTNIPITMELLERKAGIIEDYQGLVCYSADGLYPDEKILYVYYEIKFKGIATAAPTLTRFYVKQLEDQSWKIYNGPISDELTAHLEKMNAHNEVISLMVQVNRAYSQACERDAQLGKLVEILSETQPAETSGNPDESDVSDVSDEPVTEEETFGEEISTEPVPEV